MAAPVRKYKIISLSEGTHGFLQEIMTRAVGAGLIVVIERAGSRHH